MTQDRMRSCHKDYGTGLLKRHAACVFYRFCVM